MHGIIIKPIGGVAMKKSIPTDSTALARYDRIPFSDELFPIIIGMHSRLSPSTHTATCPSWHEQLEVLYITEGRVICECDFNRYICNKGDIVVINPCEAHAVEYLDCEAHYLCLMVDPKLYGGRGDISGIKYIKPMSDRRVRFRNVITDNERAKSIFMELFEEYKNASPAFEMAVKGHLLLFLSELFRSEIAEDNTNHTKSSTASISPALRYISEHYTEDISLDILSGACCMNRSYFCRHFKDITGRTPITYVNEYRLTKARSMLASEGRSVSEIAAECGFSDSNYFSRLFTKVYGTSPIKFRQTNSK